MNIWRIAPQTKNRKTAAYARVSTLSEAQEESYETQVRYYRSLIRKTEGWDFAGIYADRGISGTEAARRPRFLQMLENARKGKIDLILCKSISRFSRNFTEAEKIVHELKSLHVEVRFEKEGISTFNPSADLVFSLMAAISQEESHTLSENVKWSYRRLAEKGIRHLGNHRILGLDEVDGKLTPNRDAWIIRLIFESYAAGKSQRQILSLLSASGASRLRSSKPFNWSAVQAILQNEAYAGDRRIQKAPPRDFLTKQPDPSVPYETYYLRDDHEAIIDRKTWDLAQARLAASKRLKSKEI